MVGSGQKNKPHREVIGLVPAGGRANRLGKLPCSKEIFPIGFHRMGQGDNLCPKVVGHYLLEKMRIAGINKAYIILSDGKWDIPAYFGDGNMLAMNLAYLMMGLPYGVPFTIDQAYPFIKEQLVAFGFPDIIFEPDDAFDRLLKHRLISGADIVLGLFQVENAQKWDMVDLDRNKEIRGVVIKPQKTKLKYAWTIAVWTPLFTEFMHEYITDVMASTGQSNNLLKQEIYIGDVVQAALKENFHIESVIFPGKSCIDIGTHEDLARALRLYSNTNL
jgi:glucose-1-phosphate thymidylyltransferase